MQSIFITFSKIVIQNTITPFFSKREPLTNICVHFLLFQVRTDKLTFKNFGKLQTIFVIPLITFQLGLFVLVVFHHYYFYLYFSFFIYVRNLKKLSLAATKTEKINIDHDSLHKYVLKNPRQFT